MTYSRLERRNEPRESKRKQRFSIRKVSTVGAVSAMIGTAIFMGGSSVSADDITASQEAKQETVTEQPQDSSEEASSSSQVEETAVAPEELAAPSQSQVASDSTVETPSEEKASLESRQVVEASQAAQSQVANQASSQANAYLVTRASAAVVTNKVASTQAQEEAVTANLNEANKLELHYNGEIPQDQVLRFAVWSDKNGQDDIIWYAADKTGAAYIDLSKRHKEYGLYNIHTYRFDRNGKATGLNARTYTVEAPKVTTQVSPQGADQVLISISNVPSSITSITVPIWSDRNGQDDIRWLSATKTGEGSYQLVTSLSEYGHYSIHIYGQSSITGGLYGLAATSGYMHKDTRSDATVTLANYSEDKTSFEIVVSADSNTKPVRSVAIAAWSDDKGQDDIKWYTQAFNGKEIRQTIDIADLSNTSDTYHVHTYVYYTDGSNKGTAMNDIKIVKPAAKTQVETTLKDNGIAIKVVTNEVRNYDNVKFAVWSEDKGQDDIHWYNADHRGEVLAAFGNHKGLGIYHVHTYDFTNGKAHFLDATDFTIAQPTVKTAIDKIDNLNYKVTISEVPSIISSISLPVWSDINNQDDIKWIQATKGEDGTYVATIFIGEHKLDVGHYSVHVYGRSKLGGNLLGLAVTSGFDVSEEDVKLSMPLAFVTDFNSQNATFKVTVQGSKVSPAFKGISVAVWSTSNQSNLHWYRANSLNNFASVQVDISNHMYLSGDYNVHVYIDYLDGSSSGQILAKQTLTAPVKSQLLQVLSLASSLVGVTTGSAQHAQLIADYNSVNPKPVGYTVKTNDDWCDVFVTTVFQRAGLSDLIGRECGVDRHIQIFKSKGIWNEDGTITPKAGDIITFNWDQNYQQNDGFADHIGIVEKVENGIIYTIEGNTLPLGQSSASRQVARKNYRVGHGNIRGFATPRYS